MSAPFPYLVLSNWFKSQKRTLPWRETQDPYSIWVSEIMLQQTQVKTVIPYYKRWMQTFPTLKHLAEAPLEKVIKCWEGLGYYSRARNLQLGAQQILKEFSGVVPSDSKQLLSIKGIGPYTKGAVQSFAFKLKSTLIDGNVKRVMARYFAIEDDFSIAKNHKQLEAFMEKLVPEHEPWIFNEAIMELGATICTPKQTQCTDCPLKTSCQAFEQNRVEELPTKVKRKKRVLLHRIALVFQNKNQIAIQKKEKGLMQDLYEFPFIELNQKHKWEQQLEKHLSTMSIKPKLVEKLSEVTHGFTHHHVTLYPIKIHLDQLFNDSSLFWINAEELHNKPFSSGHRKILSQIN